MLTSGNDDKGTPCVRVAGRRRIHAVPQLREVGPPDYPCGPRSSPQGCKDVGGASCGRAQALGAFLEGSAAARIHMSHGHVEVATFLAKLDAYMEKFGAFTHFKYERNTSIWTYMGAGLWITRSSRAETSFAIGWLGRYTTSWMKKQH